MLPKTKSISSKPPIQTNVYIKAFAGLVLLFMMPLEGMLQSALCRSGAESVLDLQEGLGTPSGYHFFQALSYLGSDWVLLMLPPVLYHSFNPKIAVKVTLVLCMSLYIDSIINMIYCEPRPFWLLSDITGQICPEGYASPAPELTMFNVAYFYTAIQLTRDMDIYVQFGVYSVGAAVTLLLAFGFVYLGVLFVHQAIMTVCFDFMYLTMCLTIDSVLTRITKVSAFGYTSNRVNTVYWFVITIALMVGSIAVYDLITIQVMINIMWVENATDDCNIEFDVGSDYSFFVSASVFYSFGLMLGSMHLGKVLKEDWWVAALWRRAIRILLSCGLTLGLYFLFSTT